MTDEIVDSAIATGARRSELRLLAVLGTLMAFASISTDLYLPALPRMSVALGASQSTLELTIAGSLIGFSIGHDR